MKRIPKIGASVWMTSRKYTGSGIVVDVFSRGEACDITMKDTRGRCWTDKKEQFHKPSGWGTCPTCKERCVTISPDNLCDNCYDDNQ